MKINSFKHRARDASYLFDLEPLTILYCWTYFQDYLCALSPTIIDFDTTCWEDIQFEVFM